MFLLDSACFKNSRPFAKILSSLRESNVKMPSVARFVERLALKTLGSPFWTVDDQSVVQGSKRGAINTCFNSALWKDFSALQAVAKFKQAKSAATPEVRASYLDSLAQQETLPDSLKEELDIARTLFAGGCSSRPKQLYLLEDSQRLAVAMAFRHLPGDVNLTAL